MLKQVFLGDVKALIPRAHQQGIQKERSLTVLACSSCSGGRSPLIKREVSVPSKRDPKAASLQCNCLPPAMAPGRVEVREAALDLPVPSDVSFSFATVTTVKSKKAEAPLPALVPAATDSDAGIESRFHALANLVKNSPGGCAVIDGGLATELENRGADINDPLWSAKCLLEESSSDLVRQVHFDYFKSGADVSLSASYQATIQGFVARGFPAEKAEELLTRSVQLVLEARDQFWEECQRQAVTSPASGAQLLPFDGQRVRQKPLVGASIGSYGAYLADGSEYSGEYSPDMTLEKLAEFHRRRVQVLAAAGPDLLAFETIPNKLEAQALVKILEEENLGIPAWISFNSKDGRNVVRGDPIEDCMAVADACKHVVAVGINCTPPRFIKDLILATRKVTSKLVVIYPNSGESWDGVRKEWVPVQESTGCSDDDFTSFAPQWVEAGANLMGGCCRTTPHTISCIRHSLQPLPEEESS